jgi:hypothetical protein
MRAVMFFAVILWSLTSCDGSIKNDRGAQLFIMGEKQHVGAQVLVGSQQITTIEHSTSGGFSAGVFLKAGTHTVVVEKAGKTLFKETYVIDEKSGEVYAFLNAEK